jgi:hypothetical protein
MDKPHIFISHISEERDLATILKTQLEDDFLGLLEVFVSSDLQSIGAGQNWLESLDDGLRRSSLLVVFCSHASLRRPWVNFEVGAAWMKKIPIIPVCHSGLDPGALPIPLSILQGLKATDPDGLKRLYLAIAAKIGSRVPRGDMASLVAQVNAFEARYAPTLQSQLGPVTDRARAARKRVYDALADPEFEWRTVSKLAVVSGLSDDEVLELLIADSNVVFGRGKKSGERIAQLRTKEA